MRKPNYNNWDERKCAKKYAYDHGYYGMIGGWIYKDGRPPVIRGRLGTKTRFKRSLYNGEPICQGWDKFYGLYRREIEAYIKRLKSQD